MTIHHRPFSVHARVFLLCLALGLLAGPSPASAVDPGGRPERIVLSLTESPATEMAVAWRTSVPVARPVGQIVPATAFTDLEKKARTVQGATETVSLGDAGEGFQHTLVFKSLKPDTIYAYRLGDGKVWSEWCQFRTACKSPEPFSFVNFGDPQNEIGSKCSRLFRQAFRIAPHARFWHVTGDLVNHGGRDAEWGELFDALGWVPRTTPLIVLPGNHGYVTKLKGDGKIRRLSPLWKPQFMLPRNGPEGLEETVYFVDYQGVRLVMLNGNEKLAEQAAWLDRVLARNPQRWTIAAIHQPMYSTAKDRDNPHLRELFIPLFDRHEVDLVLQGHDHSYGRTFKLRDGAKVEDGKSGTVYVVSVSGPKVYSTSNRYDGIMAKSGTGRQLFQVIDVEKDRLRYRSYDALGEIYDSFELTK